jgi:large subunit ribosomal protein L32
MGALPKHKVSRHQRGNRRRHQALRAPEMVRCTHCGEQKRAHRVCLSCGHYKGRHIITVRGQDRDED